jgi:methyl-accepting chemotaxis protein
MKPFAAWHALGVRIPLSARPAVAAIPRTWLVTGGAVLVIALGRLLPAAWLTGIDAMLGRPGDAILALSVATLVMTVRFSARRQPAAPARGACAVEQAHTILAGHLRLDDAIDTKLNEIVSDTENSAIAIIQQVRQLHDTASTLVGYLDGSSVEAGDMGREIVGSVSCLGEIGHFVQQLPARIERDLHNVQAMAQEIQELGGLVGAVQSISMQSHLLAINAAIEASRAGPAGASFRVIADEVRSLASNSSAAAERMNGGLARVRSRLENGVQQSIAESSQQLAQISQAAASIQKLQNNFEDMSQYYKTRFAVVTRHNEDLARNIAEVLGQIQYQDVVRQCVERIQAVVGRRNGVLQDAVAGAGQHGPDGAPLPALLQAVLDDYLAEEKKHLHSARHEPDNSDSGLKIELF